MGKIYSKGVPHDYDQCVFFQEPGPAVYLLGSSCSEHSCYYQMGSFKRVEGEVANSKMLVGFKCEAEWFIADGGSKGRTRTAVP